MSVFHHPSFSLLLALLPAVLARAVEPPSSGKVDYTRDIRPILSDNCYHCHGPDEAERKAKLRLDTKEGLFSLHKDVTPFVPGKPEESESWLRVSSTDPEDLMPPPKSHRTLSPAQMALIKRWIEQGAPYQEHWAFQPLHQPEPPRAGLEWAKGPIDQFVASDLAQRHLTAAAEAPKEILLRRVSFDLTGLPPSLAELDTFLADTSPDAYEHAVDRLLASPRYGEQMARPWLDVARYGDTHGLHFDNERSMWPYRDWVVKAFNENLPFSDFTIWQLAGDLLPNATTDQKIASGFNRCNVTTNEGGSINEELLFRYTVDRTETAVVAWMGLTAGCAVCHDHKFDPISTKEFYSLSAFFNSAADPAMDGNALHTPPVLALATPEQEKALAEAKARVKDADQRMEEALAKVEYTDPASLTPPPEPQHVEDIWLKDEFPEGAKLGSAGDPVHWITAAEGPVQSGQRALKRTATEVAQDYFEGIKKGFRVPPSGQIFAYVYLDPANPPKAIMLQWHSEGNWSFRANWGAPDAIPFGTAGTPEKIQMGDLPKTGEWVRLEVPVAALKVKPGASIDGLAFTQFGGTVFWDHEGVSYEDDPATDPARSLAAWEKANSPKPPASLPKEAQQILKGDPAKRKPEQRAALRRLYLATVCEQTKPVLEPLEKEKEKMAAEEKRIDDGITKTLIMADLPQRREAHIMTRGQYDKPGAVVQPGTPAVLPPLHAEGATATRLDLAKWLVAPEHPLTARVTVNRFWQQFFGTGLVKTPGDFGAQGDPPSHPELLDWLAADFRDHAWDVKRLVKEIVMSATYRQESKATPALLEQDPENRWLARGPRFRLDAEEIRDNALFVSGLLDPTMGGKGVRTYQPENIWEPVGFVGSNTREYVQEHGAALYRRSLYTFWKRNAPMPSMTTFDAPSRDQYCTRRERSDTPLQALVTMNDVQFFEAARALGQRMLLEGGATPEERLTYGFRAVTARLPSDSERGLLQSVLNKQLARYTADPTAAKNVVTFGESKADEKLPPAELASYTLIANILLNMDEVLNKN